MISADLYADRLSYVPSDYGVDISDHESDGWWKPISHS
jgi:hypothetical protein